MKKNSLQIIVAATFTSEPVQEGMHLLADKLQWSMQLDFAPYNQIFQQLLDPESAFAKNHQGINIILFRLEDWTRDSQQSAFAIEKFIEALEIYHQRKSAPCILFPCPSTEDGDAFDVEQKKILQMASQWGFYVLSPEKLKQLYPVEQVFDVTADALGHMPYSPEMYAALSLYLMRTVHNLRHIPKKVFALDADNTLWKGICGEVGYCGIEISAPFQALQNFALRQKEQGMLLALCSKNNALDVEEVFEKNGNMQLKKDDFTALKINWNPKSANLKEIAHDLKLGLDSFIFLDDNPIECLDVQQNCPEVLTLQLPPEQEMAHFLMHLWAFDRLMITEEDRQRTTLYKQDMERQQFKQSQQLNLGQFIKALELKVTFHPIAENEWARGAQLTQRTNQFNASVVRRSVEEIQNFAQQPQHFALTVKVTDRFGDYGLVGLLLAKIESDVLFVDTLLLSCRVLGRGVETQLIHKFALIAEENAVVNIRLPVITTNRNEPMRHFLAKIFPVHFDEALKSYIFTKEEALQATFEGVLSISEEETKTEKQVEKTIPAQNLGERYAEIALHYSKPKQLWEAIEKAKGNLYDFLPQKRLLLAKDLSGNARHAYIKSIVKEPIESILNRTNLNEKEGFFDLGLDSFSVMQLLMLVQGDLGDDYELSPTVIFDYPSIERLTNHIENLLFGEKKR